jgi:RNA polymerase sigma factor (sigma-70 family)
MANRPRVVPLETNLRPFPARGGGTPDRKRVPVLLPLIARDADMSPALERSLLPVAIRAKAGDREARDALQRAFEPKLARFIRQIKVPYAHPGDHALWEREDVIQEAWLVFAALCDAWEPEIPFGRYVLANFPWRLRDAVLRGIARNPFPTSVRIQPIRETTVVVEERTGQMAEETLIEVLAMSFEEPFGDVIRHHILERRSLVETAERMGISRRSVTRYWQVILTRLRAPDPAERDIWYG